ncbi:M14 family zinc carboxypeptidase [Echinicola pacifica]|nr:M14 family zinc carboxypeptidase [Echinicola pacifica]
MKNILLAVCANLLVTFSMAQTKSPEAFLGYELGSRFTPHHRIVAYFEHVAAQNSNVHLQYYGQTYEYRPLLVVMVSAQQNMDQMEEIRKDNLRRTGLLADGQRPATNIPITWLSYNVHGNEAVSSEATMKTLWSLVDSAQTKSKEWLKQTLVVLDPCVNPDGRDRYAQWYNQKMNLILQPDLQSIEHQEPWPGGRANHYLFDLNRDWAWQAQQESEQRMSLYQEWMPNIHLDFHEQGINSPYYFAPAAAPLHEQLSEYQLEFQETFGRNTAGYFDDNNWFYFTKEVFDLLYPSYGDTYPMFNGAIGMTIEQGGSGAAGIGVYTDTGDTLSLEDRIDHHHTTALSAIEMSAVHKDKLLEEFERYFTENARDPKSQYKSFVIKGDQSPAKIQALLELLDKNKIRYQKSGKTAKLQGFEYMSGQQEAFQLDKEDLIINAWQPKSVLTQVLFEPEPALQDSLTYDITSWSLPYAYGLEAYALESKVEGTQDYASVDFIDNKANEKTLAYIAPWEHISHATFLGDLLQKGVRAKKSVYPFEVNGQHYPAGSLILSRGGNESVADFHGTVTSLANQHQIALGHVSTGMMDIGKDFGSSSVSVITKPTIGVFSGEGVSSLGFGEVWYFMEQDLEYPLSVLEASKMSALDLSNYQVLILPNGGYKWTDMELSHLTDWVKQGGKLIAMEGALNLFVDKEGFDLSTSLVEDMSNGMISSPKAPDTSRLIAPYQMRERISISDQITGAVFEVDMDSTFSLGFGLGGKYYSLKNRPDHYAYLKNGINAGIIQAEDQLRSGFVGYNALPNTSESMVFGVEGHGRGRIIYMVDNPIFRAFWENGKLIMANAIFMADE